MAIDKISRRQFLGGAATVVGAAALPTIVSVSPAAANVGQLSGFPGTTAPWVPLDAKLLARKGYEIYRGKWSWQSG